MSESESESKSKHVTPHDIDPVICDIIGNIGTPSFKSKTLIYVSIGSAVNGDNPESRKRGYQQQYPPFVREFATSNPNCNVQKIFIVIDPGIGNPPAIVRNEQTVFKTTSFSDKTDRYVSDESNMIVYCIKGFIRVRDYKPIEMIKNDGVNISRLIGPLYDSCIGSKSCIVVNDFSGRSLMHLRNAMSIQNKHSQNRCLSGLSFEGNCMPDFTKPEYQIKIHRNNKQGVWTNNPYATFDDPDEFKSQVEISAIMGDKSMIIRLRKMFDLKLQDFYDIPFASLRVALVIKNSPDAIHINTMKGLKTDCHNEYGITKENVFHIETITALVQEQMLKLLCHVVDDDVCMICESIMHIVCGDGDIYTNCDTCKNTINDLVNNFFDK